MGDRSVSLVIIGWITFFLLYWGQVTLFVLFLVEHLDNLAYVAWLSLFLPAFILIFCYFCDHCELKYGNEDEKICRVWIIWAAYIMAYVTTVGMIFGKIASSDILITNDTLGINALLGTLCITPALLILLLQLLISPFYRKPLLSLSVFAALNIFDGIEMLEIFLLQKKGHFDLNSDIEICIIVFACFCFLLSPIGLVRNKFEDNGEVKERARTSKCLGPLEIIGTNLPFLVLRAIIWNQYESAIFIAKNAVSLVIGFVEFLILVECCKCGQ